MLNTKNILFIAVLASLILIGFFNYNKFINTENLEVNIDSTFSIDDAFKNNKYMHPTQWPPQVIVLNQKFICNNAGTETAINGKTEIKNINGIEYCLTIQSEGAAGSIYTTYTYKKSSGESKDKVLSITFTIRTPQCGNYDEPQMSECKKEIENFSIDNLADQVFQNTKLN